MPRSSSLPTSAEGHLLPRTRAGEGRTDLCCEPEAGRRSSRSPYTWGSRDAPSRSCLPHSHHFPQQPPPVQALAPLSQALGSRVGKRKRRKRRQHPRRLSGPAPWAWVPDSGVAGLWDQEEGLQELLGRWKAWGKSEAQDDSRDHDFKHRYSGGGMADWKGPWCRYDQH